MSSISDSECSQRQNVAVVRSLHHVAPLVSFNVRLKFSKYIHFGQTGKKSIIQRCERAAFSIYSTSNSHSVITARVRKTPDLNLKSKAATCVRKVGEMHLNLFRTRDHSDCARACAFPGWTSPLFSECAHSSTCRVLLWHPDVQLLRTQTLVGDRCEPAGILPLLSDISRLPVSHTHTHTLRWLCSECLQLQSDRNRLCTHALI